MASIEDAIDKNPDLERSLEKSGIKSDTKAVAEIPVYKVTSTDSKIPVSNAHGKLWKSRRDQSLAKRKNDLEDVAWEEAISYYQNNQIPFRSDGEGNFARNETHARKRIRGHGETENIVFANTSSLVPAVYARNPKAEITATHTPDEEMGNIYEDLINKLFEKKAAPGLNLKPKARRSVVNTALTNLAYIEVGYTFKEDSSEQAMKQLQELSIAWSEAKTSEEIREVEGKIMAIEEKINLLRPAGPWAKFRKPQQVLRDSDSESEDLSECKWVMVWEFVPTTWIQAVYGEKNSRGQYKSIYQPSHVLNASVNGDDGRNNVEQEINNYTLLEDSARSGEDEASSYGYKDDYSYKQAQRTKVWYVWDKVTRRVYMYNDKDWSWPIWVWDDPYKLDTFFPFAQLTFYTDPERGIAKSETTYYLDQQDAINEINHEFKHARQQAKFNVAFDKNTVSREDAEKVIKGDEGVAVGVDVPEGYKLGDFLQSILPPSMQYAELFDKRPQYDAIDRVSSVTAIMRGTEFKTNTTNKAIDQYQSTIGVRLDEKIDAVEDFIGDIGYKVLQLCVQFMPSEQVARLIGEEKASLWQNMSTKDFCAQYQLTIVGGSTEKPTSQVKKQMAMEMGQVLGQFVNAAPEAVTLVMLKMFERSFSDTVLEELDWNMIQQSVQQQAAMANAPQGGEGGGGGDIEALLAQLPPEAQQAFQDAVSKGVPPEEAIARIQQAMSAPQEGAPQ